MLLIPAARESDLVDAQAAAFDGAAGGVADGRIRRADRKLRHAQSVMNQGEVGLRGDARRRGRSDRAKVVGAAEDVSVTILSDQDRRVSVVFDNVRRVQIAAEERGAVAVQPRGDGEDDAVGGIAAVVEAVEGQAVQIADGGHSGLGTQKRSKC